MRLLNLPANREAAKVGQRKKELMAGVLSYAAQEPLKAESDSWIVFAIWREKPQGTP
jgi:hypothetical protein